MAWICSQPIGSHGNHTLIQDPRRYFYSIDDDDAVTRHRIEPAGTNGCDVNSNSTHDRNVHLPTTVRTKNESCSVQCVLYYTTRNGAQSTLLPHSRWFQTYGLRESKFLFFDRIMMCSLLSVLYAASLPGCETTIKVCNSGNNLVQIHVWVVALFFSVRKVACYYSILLLVSVVFLFSFSPRSVSFEFDINGRISLFFRAAASSSFRSASTVPIMTTTTTTTPS